MLFHYRKDEIKALILDVFVLVVRCTRARFWGRTAARSNEWTAVFIPNILGGAGPLFNGKGDCVTTL